MPKPKPVLFLLQGYKHTKAYIAAQGTAHAVLSAKSPTELFY